MLQVVETPIEMRAFSLDEIRRALARTARKMPPAPNHTGGAVLGFASKDSDRYLCLRRFGKKLQWVAPFDELTKMKLSAALRTGVSTRFARKFAPGQLLPEERVLHPGGLCFGNYATACSGHCEDNEKYAELLSNELGLR